MDHTLPDRAAAPLPGPGGPVPLFWWRAFHFTNFGDELSWLLTRQLSGRSVAWRSPRSTCVVGLGSLLEMVARQPPDPRSSATRTIWGAGCMFDQPLPDLPRTRWLAVRGELTLSHLPAAARRQVRALGDPGLLIPQIIPVPPGQTGPVLVPHYLDADLPDVQRMRQAIPGLRVISATADPQAVATAIAGAEYLITSALHPLIVAEAYGVPAIWTQLSRRIQGGRFKFDDFYSALGTRREPVPARSVVAARGGGAELATVQADRTAVATVQQGLLNTFDLVGIGSDT